MSEPARIEVATREAIDELVLRFANPAAPESSHESRWRTQQAGDGVFFLAWKGEEPVGWVLLKWHASAQAAGEHLAELEGLDVLEAHRRQGIARALLDAAATAARAAGMAGLGLKVTVSNPWNEAARQLYAGAGFVDSGAGEFDDGYWYWTPDGEKHWDGEPHRYLVRRF